MPKIKGLSWESLKAITWNFSGMAFSLVTGIITARILSPSDRGILALAITLSTFAYLFSSVGTNVAVRTFQPTKHWASFRTYFSLSIKLLFIDLILISILTSIYIYLGVITMNASVLWIAILSLGTFLSNQLLDALNASGLVSYSALLNTIGYFGTMLAMLGVYFFIDSSRIVSTIAAYFFGYTIRAIGVLYILKSKRILLGEKSKSSEVQLLTEGTKFWGVNIGQTVTFRADQLLLGALSGAHEVGIYAVALTPTNLMQVISNTLGQVMFRQAAIGKLTLRTTLRTIATAFGVTFVYGLILWFLSPFLIPLVFGEAYADSVKVVRILLLGELFLSPYLIIVRILSGLNHPYVASWSGLIGLVTLVPLMLFLVPILGSTGAAISAVCCFGSMTLWVSYFLFKSYRNDLESGSG